MATEQRDPRTAKEANSRDRPFYTPVTFQLSRLSLHVSHISSTEKTFLRYRNFRQRNQGFEIQLWWNAQSY